MRFSDTLADLSLQGYHHLGAGCLGLKLQTNRPVITPIFRTRRLQADHSFRYSFCFPSVAIMALRKNILQEDDILCELYVDTRSDVSDNSDNESLDSDSDVSGTSSRKQLPSSVVVVTSVTSNSETSTVEEEISEPENSDDKRSDVWFKSDKKPSNEPFLGTTGLNIVIHNPESVVEVVSSIIRYDLILLLTQSNLYHSQNVEKWKVSSKTLKWSNITPEEMRKFLWLIIDRKSVV
jgi:hypothetical protein